MAKAVLRTEPPVPPEIIGVTLDLSLEEAKFLADVFAKIGGDPIKSRRRHQESISKALQDAGVYWKPASDIHGGLEVK